MSTNTQTIEFEQHPEQLVVLAWRNIAPLVAFAEAAGLLGAAFISSVIYYSIAYGQTVSTKGDLSFETTVTIFYVLVRILRGDYAYSVYIASSGNLGRICRAWFLAFLAVLAAVFLLKVGSELSRGMAFSLFFVGPIVLSLLQRLLASLCLSACKSGLLAVRRIFVIGGSNEVEDFRSNANRARFGQAIIGSYVLGDGSDPDEESQRITRAVAAARRVNPNDILIALPLGDHARIQGLVEACKVIPASIHLGADLLLKKYPALRTVRAGDTASLELVREPLTPAEQIAKRCFDVMVAILALVLLSPLFAVVAILIKLDSSGPVFFRQDRHCYNRRRFKIFKFRTMYSAGPSDTFVQAKRDDPRITPIGAWLRRTNIDELPQLINVLIGDMSIVGPRPHAVEHDEDFEKRIAYYSRRHNIKPGITGWAQVNGLRGETDTDEKMRARVEHDLAYLDHWSLLFDLKIVLLTFISPRAYHNAV